MRKRKIFFVLLLALLPFVGWAQQVSKQEALVKAQQFFSKTSHTQVGKGKVPRKAPVLTLANDNNEYYVFNDEVNGGFVIVSGDERMPDVLGYSYDGHFDADNIPCNMRALFEGYVGEVKYVQTHNISMKEKRKLEEVEWDYIPPLLATEWNQIKPYNNQCPIISGQHCLTGCSATAMAQVLAYYEWPMQTTKTIPEYKTETNGITVPAIEPTTIDWENMLTSYNGYYSNNSADAVANLMKLCGASINMDYGVDVSTSRSSISDALVEYFGYSEDAMYLYPATSLYGFETMEYTIYKELVKERPVIYVAFSYEMGHAMVIDGFSGDSEERYFHINYGWGGAEDGYYLLPEAPIYNMDPYAYIGIQPLRPDYPRAYGVLNGEEMTLYYDNQHESRTGTVIPSFKSLSGNKEMTKCVIDSSCKAYELLNLDHLFLNCSNLQEIVGLENLNTSCVTSMECMFFGCSSLTNLYVSGFKTDNVTSMNFMFSGCSSLTSLDVSGFKTDKVTNMDCMFDGCSSLTSLDVSGFNTNNVTYMGCMFYGCSGLTSLDVSGFKTDKVEDMSSMFSGCSNLTNLDVSGFKTDNVTDLCFMFFGCSSLTSLDVSGFKTDNVTIMDWMFKDCSSLTSIYASEKWNMSNVETSDNMFGNCYHIVGGVGTVYDWNHVGGEYARIDGGPDNPGYFTYKEAPNSISTITSGSTSVRIYDMQGKRLDKLKKGLNIVVMQDGTVKKIRR